MRITDLADAIAPGCKVVEIGIRPGEKLHETLVSEDEARNAVEVDGMFVIKPAHAWWGAAHWPAGLPLDPDFRYNSESNAEWLSADQLRAMLDENLVATSVGA
jgi:UDP-N-acetylglucosamine 4,6-dehydratase